MDKVKYKKPSGMIIEVNDMPATRNFAAQNGWVEVKAKAPAKKKAAAKKAPAKKAKK